MEWDLGQDESKYQEEGGCLLCLHSHHDDDDGAYGGARDGYELMAKDVWLNGGAFYHGAVVQDVPNVDNPD